MAISREREKSGAMEVRTDNATTICQCRRDGVPTLPLATIDQIELQCNGSEVEGEEKAISEK